MPRKPANPLQFVPPTAAATPCVLHGQRAKTGHRTDYDRRDNTGSYAEVFWHKGFVEAPVFELLKEIRNDTAPDKYADIETGEVYAEYLGINPFAATTVSARGQPGHITNAGASGAFWVASARQADGSVQRLELPISDSSEFSRCWRAHIQTLTTFQHLLISWDVAITTTLSSRLHLVVPRTW